MSEPRKRFFENKAIDMLAVHGPLPDEFACFELGKPCRNSPPLTRIVYREEYYGTHSHSWFDLYAGERCVYSVSEGSVDEVGYADGDEWNDPKGTRHV